MREHKIVTWCDVHAMANESDDSAEPVPAEHVVAFSITLNSTELREPVRRVDLCADCVVQLAGLIEVVEQYGAALDAGPINVNGKPARKSKPAAVAASPPQEPDPGSCPLCNRHMQWLAAHVGTTHSITADDQRLDDGTYACPACDNTFDGKRQLVLHAKDDHGARLAVLIATARAVAKSTPAKPAAKRARKASAS